jgi:hypothetical protein
VDAFNEAGAAVRFAPGSNDFEPEFACIDFEQPVTRSRPPSSTAMQEVSCSVRMRLSLLLW